MLKSEQSIERIRASYIKNEEYTRLISELDYCSSFSKAHNDKYDALIDEAVSALEEKVSSDKLLKEDDVIFLEKKLSFLGKEIKKQTILCLGHAHIDLNWMWGYEETVNVALATFSTMLDLMDEYPDFVFAQSQAVLYRIVEKYDPKMLDEIKQRVRENRWEVTASSITEPDDNMPNGEGLTREIVNGKLYLSELLGIKKEDMDIYFVPDTFGHNANLPEILNQAGIKYFYHCRGRKVPVLFNWKADSAASVLAFCEPFWYNSDINAESFVPYPSLMKETGTDTFIKIFGVGDHGGGATRRDLEMLKTISAWPLMPSIKGGTLKEFFQKAEKQRSSLPTVNGEINKVFTGCYTSQSKLKEANYHGERELLETEALTAFASSLGLKVTDKTMLEEAWNIQCFNHFHDILPGSGVEKTREYALGQAQVRDADLSVLKTKAAIAIASQIKIDVKQDVKDAYSTSQGAGSGFGVENGIGAAEKSSGPNRYFLAFNSSEISGRIPVIFELWDYFYPIERLEIKDSRGNTLPFEIIDSSRDFFGHSHITIETSADIQAWGYQTIETSQKDEIIETNQTHLPEWWREEKELGNYVLENSHLRVEINKDNGSIAAIKNKDNGEELSEKEGFIGCLEYFAENGQNKRMSSWIQSPDKTREDLLSMSVINPDTYKPTGICKSICGSISFNNNKVAYSYKLQGESPFLDIALDIDFKEVGVSGESVPGLRFVFKKVSSSSQAEYRIPYGTIKRKEEDEDVVSNNLICIDNEKSRFVVLAEGKYGFRYFNGNASVSLLRASCDPDPYPEFGLHKIQLHCGMLSGDSEDDLLLKTASLAERPAFAISMRPSSKGTLAPCGAFVSCQGKGIISSIKESFDGSGIVVRLYSLEDKKTSETLKFSNVKIKEAFLCDSFENKGEKISNKEGAVSFELKSKGITAVFIRLI